MCFVANKKKTYRFVRTRFFVRINAGLCVQHVKFLYIASILHAHHLQSYKKIKVHMHGTFRNSSSHLALKVMAFCAYTHSYTHAHTHTPPSPPPHTHACNHLHTHARTHSDRQTDR